MLIVRLFEVKIGAQSGEAMDLGVILVART